MVFLEKYKKTFLKRIKYTTAKAQKFHTHVFNIFVFLISKTSSSTDIEVKNTTKRYTELSQVSLSQPRKATGKKGTLYIEEEMAGHTLAVNVQKDSSPRKKKLLYRRVL